MARLKQAGVDPVLPKGADPSLAVASAASASRSAISSSSTRRSPAAASRWCSASATASRPRGPAERPAPARSEIAAWYVADILCRALPPANAKPGLVCYKTGTSYGFRDAWAVGFDGRHVVGVWVGRPDGAAGLGPLRHQRRRAAAVRGLRPHRPSRAPLPPPPPGVLLATTGELPPPLKRFREGAVEDGQAGDRSVEPAPRIAFPPDRAEIEVEEGEDGTVVAKAEGGALPLTWLLDGAPIASDPARHEAELPAGRRGFFRLSVIDAKGRTDRVTIRVK